MKLNLTTAGLGHSPSSSFSEFPPKSRTRPRTATRPKRAAHFFASVLRLAARLVRVIPNRNLCGINAALLMFALVSWATTFTASATTTSTNKPLLRLKPRVTEEMKRQEAEAAVKATNVTAMLAGPEPLQIVSAVAAKAAQSDHPLASLWADPEFQKRLAGSYGFHPELEPKPRNTNEYNLYFQQVVPALGSNDHAGIVQLLATNEVASSNALFHFIAGNSLSQLGRDADAAKQYAKAVELFPSYLRAHQNLGYALVKSGQYAEAVKPLARTLELGGVNANTYGLLAYCYLSQEKYLAAESAYRQAVLLMPDNNDWKMGLLKSQIATGRLAEADKLLQEMIAAAPDNDSLWNLQAGLFMQMDQPAKAAMNYEMLRRMGKADLKTLMLLGDIYLTMDARELALGAYLEGIAKDGATDLARSLRAADILVRSGAWTEGGKLIQEIRRLHGGKLGAEEDMKLLKLESRVAMAAGEGEKAAGVLEQIIQRNPLDGEALLLLGDHFARAGEKEKAAFRYELAAKLAEFEPDSLVKQAQLLVSDRKFERAVEQLRKAQKLKHRDNVQRYLESVERLARGSGS